jgi:hypothetical protein
MPLLPAVEGHDIDLEECRYLLVRVTEQGKLVGVLGMIVRVVLGRPSGRHHALLTGMLRSGWAAKTSARSASSNAKAASGPPVACASAARVRVRALA